MSDLMKVGSDWGGQGTFKPFTSGISGAQRVLDAHGRYFDSAFAGRIYSLSATAAAPTAYVGAAGGTPLIAAHNPANSGKVLVCYIVGFAQRAIATAAGQTGLALWSGPSVVPTGTKTSPTNAYTLAASGASALGFVNAALTGSTALALALPLYTHYWATAAAAWSASAMFDIGGIVMAAPGNQIALGLTVVPTSVTVDVSLFWEEVPALLISP